MTTETAKPLLKPPFHAYDFNGAFDEMFQEDGTPRTHYEQIYQKILGFSPEELAHRQRAADLSFLHQGITFTVYGREEGTERIFPYDLMPRIIPGSEWKRVDAGLKQRITALNLFLKDVYHDGKILKDKVVPAELIRSCKQYRPEMEGVHIPLDRYIAIVGTDLIRDDEGEYRVLEDNLRVPSGVSYMLGNRTVMKKVFPVLFREYAVRSIDDYGRALLATMGTLAPEPIRNPNIVVLTPGVYNSAYFE
ncbi:MAG: circularly permuted type 2 ATP-grasp protein, partial [Candidatus Sumerlaeia bacterium]|nr:circularly permuted type 2 ATP-grasp protein [Candidatus Sumerlaeia bacterium]